MSEAFKCDYCKNLYEGQPRFPPTRILPRFSIDKDKELEIKVGEKTWVIGEWGYFSAYVDRVRVDLCNECRSKLFRQYLEHQKPSKNK